MITMKEQSTYIYIYIHNNNTTNNNNANDNHSIHNKPIIHIIITI